MGAQWKVKHKEVAANLKGRVFGKMTKEIMVAARNGADPDTNSRLRLAIEQAKKASMPKDTLERAIKKGAGLLDGAVHYEKLSYEGFAPHNVALIVECLTDNVNRTVSEIRVLFRAGQLGAEGSVAWDFDHVGLIEARAENADVDIDAAAIEAGAQDYEAADQEGLALFITDTSDLDAVCRALPEFGYAVETAKIGYRPKHPQTLAGAELEEVEAFLSPIHEHDDVQEVYVALEG